MPDDYQQLIAQVAAAPESVQTQVATLLADLQANGAEPQTIFEAVHGAMERFAQEQALAHPFAGLLDGFTTSQELLALNAPTAQISTHLTTPAQPLDQGEGFER